MDNSTFVMVLFVVGLAVNHIGMERLFRSYERQTGRSFDRVRMITVGVYMALVFAFSSAL